MIMSSQPQNSATIPPSDSPAKEVVMDDHDFWKGKFDNICLFAALVLMAFMVIHFVHHSADGASISWAQTTFTTVLGAYIGLTQAHRLTSKPSGNGKDGGDAPKS